MGRAGAATVVALAFFAFWLAPAASAADGAISGKVTKAGVGTPVLSAEVCAETESGIFVFECTSTEADGTYEIAGLPPAGYVVSFWAGESGLYLIHQFWEGVGRYGEATEVTVVSGMTATGIDAAMVEGGAIAGKVTAAANGAPIGEVEVCSASEGGGEFDGCAYTAGDGTYEIVGVAPGLHELEFWASKGNYEPQFLSSVQVSVGVKTSNVNAALKAAPPPPNGRISGHVYRAATHEPLGGITVCAIDGFNESRGCAHTAKSGAYEFVGVPAGLWRVAFSPEPAEFESFEVGEIKSDAWPTQFWNLKPTLAQADAINVAEGGVITGIDGLLGPGPATTPNPPPTTGPASVAVRPPLRCKRGLVKRRVKGKARCVKVHKHRRHRHHRRKAGR